MGVAKSILLIAYLALLLSDKTFINAALPCAASVASAGSACFYCLLIAQVKHKQSNAHRHAYAMHLPQHQRHEQHQHQLELELWLCLSGCQSVCLPLRLLALLENVIRVEALGGQLSSNATDIARTLPVLAANAKLEVGGQPCHDEHDASVD